MEKTLFGSSPVLAIAPFSRGVGYALFETLDSLADWGTRDVRVPRNAEEKNHRSLVAVRALFALYRPTTLVLPERDNKRRSGRVKQLIHTIAETAAVNGIAVVTYAKHDLAQVFAGQGARSKYEMARVAARLFPELASSVPPKRRIWDGEQYKMAMFEAVVLGVVHLTLGQPQWVAPG